MVTVGLLFCALMVWMGWLLGHSQGHLLPTPAEPATPPAAKAPVQCLSYAPFRRPGQAPWVPGIVVSPEQILEDLRLLRPLTGCVRTYGVDLGLDAVPAAARTLGMRVLLGVWIGRDDRINRLQLDQGLALARDYPDVVDLLIVGNEVLLRREQSPEGLARWLAEARAASPVPVAYADVWEFWQRHADALRPHVDVVAAHILPYWEDHPVAVADAVDHVHRIAAQLDTEFAPLQVLIAETGWPAAGRQRGAAVPGVAEQTRFVRELLARPLPRYNLIEGFDQPWKRALEGAMGGYWGLLDADGQPRVVLDGPTPPDPRVPRLWAWTLIGALLGALAGGLQLAGHVGAGRRWPSVAVAAMVGALLLPLALLQWQMLHVWNRSPLEWGIGGAYTLVALLTGLLAAAKLSRPGGQTYPLWAERSLRWLHLALLFATAWVALGLVFDARYRPLVWPLLAVPVGVLLLLVLGQGGGQSGAWKRWGPQVRLLAGVCALAAPLLVALEGVHNTQAWAAAALWLVLAVASWLQVGGAWGRGRGGDTHAQPASNTASAARSVE